MATARVTKMNLEKKMRKNIQKYDIIASMSESEAHEEQMDELIDQYSRYALQYEEVGDLQEFEERLLHEVAERHARYADDRFMVV